MGSIMLQYVRDYKRDPSDETIAFNACDVSPANIDFDGEIYSNILVIANTTCITLMFIAVIKSRNEAGSPNVKTRVIRHRRLE